VDRPALVAEVPLELTEDRRGGEAGEPVATAGLEAIDRLQQPQARDLDEVVDVLVGVPVAKRQLARERQEAPDELFA
jgi:hypothetical protein